MSQYNIFQAIGMSFYSKKLYRDVAQSWGGKALLYLFVLLALSWIGFTIYFQEEVSKGYAEFSGKYVRQIPLLTLKDGKVATPENKPYVVIDPSTKKTFLIIDTTGKYNTLDEAQTDFLITKDAIYSRSNNSVRIDHVPESFDTTVDATKINNVISGIISWAWVIIMIFMLLGSFFLRMCTALIYAIVGKIFAKLSSTPVSYGQIYNIVLVAMTPVIVISTISQLCAYIFPMEGLFFIVLTLVYMIFGILANKQQ